MNGGHLLIIVIMVYAIVHKVIIPTANAVIELKRIKSKFPPETIRWLIEEE